MQRKILVDEYTETTEAESEAEGQTGDKGVSTGRGEVNRNRYESTGGSRHNDGACM
jgi:hypothetical protein